MATYNGKELEALCCAPATSTTILTNYTSIQKVVNKKATLIFLLCVKRDTEMISEKVLTETGANYKEKEWEN